MRRCSAATRLAPTDNCAAHVDAAAGDALLAAHQPHGHGVPSEIVELFDELNEMQLADAPVCAGRRAVVFSFSSFQRYGFATALHHVSLALLYARDTDRLLVLRKPDTWIYASPTCSDGFECYFHTLARCTEDQVLDGRPRPRQALHEANEADDVVLYTSSGATYNVVSSKGARYRTLVGWGACHRCRSAPTVVARQRHVVAAAPQSCVFARGGRLSRRAALVRRRADDWRARAPRRQENGSRSIARNARICMCVERVSLTLCVLGVQIDVALRLRAHQPALKTLFVSSDDPVRVRATRRCFSSSLVLWQAVIHQAISEGAKNGFRVIYRYRTVGWLCRRADAPPRRQETRTNDAVHSLLTRGEIDALDQVGSGGCSVADAVAQGTTALTNIWLLSLCDELIGTFSSSFFKLSYELRFARTRNDKAHSLDLSAWRA